MKQAQPQIHKKQKSPQGGDFCLASSWSVIYTNPTVILAIIITIILSSSPTRSLATDFSSNSFFTRDPIISDFGGKSTSDGFELLNAGGQTITGESSSASFSLKSGFFYFDTFTPKSQNWRWYDDEASETPVTALAAENVAPSNVDNRAIAKLRITLKETKSIGATIKFKLQFSKTSDFSSGIVDVVSQGACTTYSRWCYADGGGADNGVITTGVLTDSDSCVASVGDGCGTHNESGTSAATFNQKKDTATEYEFTVEQHDAEFNQTYFFRAFDTTNNIPVPLNTGEAYPSIGTSGTILTFSVAGLASGTVTEGVTTDVTTTATTVPFETLAIDTEIEAAQRLTVTTNAAKGYKIFVKETDNLKNMYGTAIADVTATNASPDVWAIPGGTYGAYGYHAGDNELSGGSTRFSTNNTYAQLDTTAREIAFNAVPVTAETNDMIYKIQINKLQQTGDYNTTIQYIIVATY